MVGANRLSDSTQNNCNHCAVLHAQIAQLNEQLKEMEERAHHDVLTGLPNRRYFVEALQNRISRCQRYGDVAALLSLDVDDLKKVNDSFGHQAGDLLLKRLAELLHSNVRASDMVARIGGDEFAILLDNMDAPQVELKISFLRNLITSTEIRSGDHVIRLGAAIGFCFIGPDDTVSELMSSADQAMYKAKKSA